MRNYSSINEHEQEGNDANESSSSPIECGCLRLPCFHWNKTHEVHSESIWLVRKVEEFPELIAGPKWKNLVKKIGNICNSKKSKIQFHYDAQSYALNFDDGVVEEDELLCNFSSRFAVPISVNQKQSRDGM